MERRLQMPDKKFLWQLKAATGHLKCSHTKANLYTKKKTKKTKKSTNISSPKIYFILFIILI